MKRENYEKYIKLNYYQIDNPVLRIVIAEKDLIRVIRGSFESPLREIYRKNGMAEKIDIVYAYSMYYGLDELIKNDPEILIEAHQLKVRVGKRKIRLDKILWQGQMYPFLLFEDKKYCELVIKYLDEYRPCLHEICMNKY